MDTRISSRISVVVGIIAAVLAVLGAPAGAAPPGDFIEYPLPTAGSMPRGITAGPDGNLWFTEASGMNGKIGRITPDGDITEYPLAETPRGDSFTNSHIAAGPDGNMWFTDVFWNKIGRITPTGAITEYPLPKASSQPSGPAPGPDGNMWFTETTYRFVPGPGPVATGSTIGRITPEGRITEYPLPKADSQPGGIAAGPDGNLWFTETTQHSGRRGTVYSGSAIGRITPAGRITEYPLPKASSQPGGIAAGPDGNLWFTESEGNGKIGRITPAGIITEYPLPTHPSYPDGGNPSGIAAGPDGNMWFTELIGNKIGRITPAGIITEYHTPTGISHPAGIVAGPDGNLWFTEMLGSAIGRITPTATPTVARMTCPLAVTLHSPIPKGVGNRILTDRITTKKSSCVLPRPLVRCQPLASSTTGKRTICDKRITKRGQIRVAPLRGGSVRVTVSIRVKPQPGFADRWKSNTWTGAWTLRDPPVAKNKGDKNKGETDLTLSEGLVQGMDAAGVGIEAIRGATLSESGVVTFRVKSVKGDVITHKGALQFSSSAGFVTLQNIALNYTTGKATALVQATAVPTGTQITDVLTFTGGKNQIKQNGTWKNAKVALATSTSMGNPAPLFASQLGLPAGSIATGMTIGKANITLKR